MQTNIETEDVVIQKTRELCETILQQPEYQSIRTRTQAFMGDAAAQRLFEALNEKGRYLHNKQHQGEQLTESEIASFDKLRDSLLANPVAKGFVEAQQDMHHLEEGIGQLVSKTLELGRVPTAEELGEGGCCGGHGGGGCGCSH